MTNADDHAASLAEIEARDNRIANLKARCRAAGYELMIIAAGDGSSTFIARFGRTLDLPDVAAVGDWLDRIGAR